MKQTLFIIILISLISFCKPKQSPSNSITSIVYYQTQGEVQFFDPSGKTYSPKLLDQLPDGAKIKTGKGKVDLLLATGGLVRVYDRTELTLDTKFLSDKNETSNRLKIQLGQVFVSQPTSLKKGESLVVSTPTQIGGVRGTEFLTVVEDTSSKILVSQGQVQTEKVSDPNAETNLAPESEVISEGNKSEADDQKRETLPLTDEEKALLKNESKSAAELILEAKEQMQSIREQFEEEKARIKVDLEKFKTENKQILDEQKNANKATIDEQKAKNADLINTAKGNKDKETRDLQDAKDSQKGDIKNNAKSELDAIKQGMKK
jgi:hypothetical protein